MDKAKIQQSSPEFLFRPLSQTKPGGKLRDSGKLSYGRLRELFKQKLRELGFPAERFGLHSLWAGVATAAARAGVPDRLFERHGRWQSENVKD